MVFVINSDTKFQNNRMRKTFLMALQKLDDCVLFVANTSDVWTGTLNGQFYQNSELSYSLKRPNMKMTTLLSDLILEH